MRMESDTLDALVAEQTGLSARSVQNLRGKLKGTMASSRPIPEKDEYGTVTRWLIARTGSAQIMSHNTTASYVRDVVAW